MLDGREVKGGEFGAGGQVGGDGKPNVDMHATMVGNKGTVVGRVGAMKSGEVGGDFGKGVGSRREDS